MLSKSLCFPVRQQIMPEVIFDNDELQLLHHQAESPFTLVTFGPRGTYANGKGFWGEPIARKAGINTFGFMAKRANWYPEAAVTGAIAAIESLRGEAPLVTYGGSMGAYGAIKFADRLKANHVIAFTPQYSIDPKIVGDDDIFATNYVDHLHRGVLIEPTDCTVPVYMFFDPFVKQDRRHRIALNRVLPQVVDLNVPFAGHSCVEVFSRADLITHLFALCRAGDADAIRAFIAKTRRASGVRTQVLANMLIRRRPEIALAIVAKHGATFRPAARTQSYFQIATALMNSQRFDLARDAIAQAIDLEPTNANFSRRRSQIELRAGAIANAVLWGLTATEQNPKDWLNHFDLGKALASAKLRTTAKEALNRAEALASSGDSRKYIDPIRNTLGA
jgi:hypothetical protein